MPERPDNFEFVLNYVKHSRRFSEVRFECIKEKLDKVMSKDANPKGYEDWTEKDARDALNCLD